MKAADRKLHFVAQMGDACATTTIYDEMALNRAPELETFKMQSR